jgi:hypothetical protein
MVGSFDGQGVENQECLIKGKFFLRIIFPGIKRSNPGSKQIAALPLANVI